MAPLRIPLGVVGSVGRRIPSGGTITEDTTYVYHTFLSSDEFNNPIDGLDIQYLVVAGGGSASTSYHGGGGGGAGGLSNGSLSLAKNSYAITVGDGGATTPASNTNGKKGDDSSIGSLVIAAGGGAGIMNWETSSANGGSGGGACNVSGNPSFYGSGVSGQGNNGGSSFASNSEMSWPGGGGGGAGNSGQNAQNVNYGGAGGNGLQFLDWANATSTGDSGYYAGGGAGGINGQAVGAGINDAIQGGLGGGGNSGVYYGSTSGLAGQANTGGGGGAPNFGNNGSGGAGGSGVVIIRYPKTAISNLSEYWLSIGSSDGDAAAWLSAVDSEGNSYAAGGWYQFWPNEAGLITKRNLLGEIIWETAPFNEQFVSKDMKISPYDDSVYVSSTLEDYSYERSFAALMEVIPSSGTGYAPRVFGNGTFEIGSAIFDIDNAGNSYICARVRPNPSSTTTLMMIAKLNSFGTLQWAKSIDEGRYNFLEMASLSVDKSTGDIYLAGETRDSFSVSAGVAIKINSSGTLQWAKELYDPSLPVRIYGGTLDSSNNLYLIGFQSASIQIINKINSSGNIVWQRQVSSGYLKRAVTDSNNNLFVTLSGAGGSYTDILKFDSNGNLLWQRRILGYGDVLEYLQPSVSSEGDFFLPGSRVDGAFASAMIKLPGDGSLTGTYGPISYSYAFNVVSSYNLDLVSASHPLSTYSVNLSDGTAAFTSPGLTYEREDIK